jgi:UDP-N-acetylglucosamine diphosphorylase/glucosamine-1-phosphate N-acetyltransferase
MHICVFEDAAVERLEPLTLTRPAFDLWCGAGTLLQRQMRAFLTTAVGAVVRPEVKPLCRMQHPAIAVNDPEWVRAGPLAWVNARWLPPDRFPCKLGKPEVGLADEQIAYVVPPEDDPGVEDFAQLPEALARWKDELPHRAAKGAMVNYLWELLEQHTRAVQDDFEVWRDSRQCLKSPAELSGPVVIGPPERLLVAGNAHVEALSVIDTTRGPVLIDRQAVVRAFSRLEGPCYIGPRTQVRGGTIRASSIGPECRIGGEVEGSILQGYTNKYHDGFLGHSYVGEWVNLGAGTQVADLRTDYWPVTVAVAGQWVDTGRLKAGAFFGDHTKTGLGTLLNTGSVAGPFAQLLPSGGLLPRLVPPFCASGRGELRERTDLRCIFATAETVMHRRGCDWSPVWEEFFLGLYERTYAARQRVLREAEQRLYKQVI